MTHISLVGLKLEKVLVIEEISTGNYLCRCDCGKEFSVPRWKLKVRTKFPLHCGDSKHRRISATDRTVRRYYRGELKKSAVVRGIQFSLNIEEVKDFVIRPCYYCGEVLDESIEIKKSGKYTIEVIKIHGIDRVDNSKGYVQGNCVPCCTQCNIDKRSISVNSMKKALEFLGYTVTENNS